MQIDISKHSRALRPPAVTMISVIYIAAGTIGFLYHATEFKSANPFQPEWILVCLIRLIAIAGGIFALKGRNWARWLLIVWMAYHVALSAFHSIGQCLAHAFFLAIIAFFMFQARANAFFGGTIRFTGQAMVP